MSLTSLERAAQLWCLPQFADRVMDVEFAKAIAAAIAAAVAEEREACAKLCDEWARNYRTDEEDCWAESVEMAAAAIRARKETP